MFFVYQAGQDFHADLYPDTAGQTPAMTAEDWWKGENKQVLTTFVLFMGNSMNSKGFLTENWSLWEKKCEEKEKVSQTILTFYDIFNSLIRALLQVERVSLHPSKRPKPATPSAQETKPKDLPRGKSKEVCGRNMRRSIYFIGIIVLQCLFLFFSGGLDLQQSPHYA